jgi:cytochrome c oxidase subunit II
LRDRTATGSPRTRSRPIVPLLLLAAVVVAGCAGEQSALEPQGPYAQQPHDLILPVFAIAAVVFVFVQGLIIYSVVRYRQRPDDDGSLPVQVHGNTRLEIAWTVVPAVILAVIAVPTVAMIFDLADEPEDEFITVEVYGHRWWFEYYYPEFDIYTANEMAIPVGVPVRLEMTSTDPARQVDQGVIHSFWIPPLAGKQDLVPGQLTTLNIQADTEGYYYGQCAEYCGLSHVNMRARVRALEAGDWEAWVENQTSPAAIPEDGSLEAQGREYFQELTGRQACASCHAVFEEGGSRAPGTGPDLTHLMSRDEFAGAIVDMTEENLRAWLADPDSIKPMQYDDIGIGMPNLELSEDELDALVAYLLTLE